MIKFGSNERIELMIKWPIESLIKLMDANGCFHHSNDGGPVSDRETVELDVFVIVRIIRFLV